MSPHKPQILIAEDEAGFARLAADTLVHMMAGLDCPLVTLPTGMTPLGMYQALAADPEKHRVLWGNMRFVALDEYAGLPPDDERLFGNWLARACLDPLGIQNRMLFDSAVIPEDEAQRMEQWLQAEGALDLAVLGLGSNGHVAFNEPGTPFETGVHALDLTAESIRANARYWGDESRVPRRAVTLGLRNLAAAKRTLVLVNGASKADILNRALNGPVGTDVPASYWQTISNVTIVADRAAASSLNEA